MVASRATALGRRTSNAELAARELLTLLGVKWSAQVPIATFVVDLLVEPATVVEVHGGYWHDKPDIRARDKKRTETLEALGYRVIILRQDQMHLWWRALQSSL